MAAEAEVTWVVDRRFVGRAASGHGIVVDGSADKLGPSPMELVLIGLAGCTAYDVVDILEKKRAAVSGLIVRVKAERATESPRVYTAIAIEYLVRGHEIKPQAVEDAIRLSVDKYCSVSAMLSHTAEITTSYRIEEPA
jgi:putative redox protein